MANNKNNMVTLIKHTHDRIKQLEKDDLIHPSSKAKLIKENKRFLEMLENIKAQPESPTMKPHEKLLAAQMLRLASDEFTSHGCNDVDDLVYEGWTLDQRKEFVKGRTQWRPRKL